MRAVSLDLEAKPYANPQQVRIQLSGNPCRVPACGYLAGDAFICPSCVEAWECDLGNVAAMVEDLEVAARKQVRFGTREGNALAANGSTTSETRHLHTRHPNHTEPPMPADLRAGYWQHRLRGELVGQVRLICESGHITIPALRDDTVAMSRWLLRQSARIAYLPEQDGWGLIHDLAQMMADCTQAIDAPARRKYVRVCEDCGLGVWARDDKARCACGREYDAAAEYEARIVVARDAWVTLLEASSASGTKLDTIKKWIRRGKGGQCMETSGSEPQRVRYGDVLDWAAAAKEKMA